MNILQIDETWNPIIGCLYDCRYCRARIYADNLQESTEKYKDGFCEPKLVENELNRVFRNKLVAVSLMGEMFGEWVPDHWILGVLKVVVASPKAMFLFMTKNPKRYIDLLNKHIAYYPKNVILGATIESNRDFPVTKAPSVVERYNAMKELQFERKQISIEPIMDFDFDVFLQWIKDIKPILVSIGYDNHYFRLSEPDLHKTKQFIAELQKFTEVKQLNLRERVSQFNPEHLYRTMHPPKLSNRPILAVFKQSRKFRPFLSKKGKKQQKEGEMRKIGKQNQN